MKTPEQIQKELQAMMAEARETHAYRLEGAILEFTEDMVQLMKTQGVANSELAKRIETSPAYITKILRGTTNFTLDTMVKIATALHAEFRCHLQPKGSRSLWVDYPVAATLRQAVPVPSEIDLAEAKFNPTELPVLKATAGPNETFPAAA